MKSSKNEGSHIDQDPSTRSATVILNKEETELRFLLGKSYVEALCNRDDVPMGQVTIEFKVDSMSLSGESKVATAHLKLSTNQGEGLSIPIPKAEHHGIPKRAKPSNEEGAGETIKFAIDRGEIYQDTGRWLSESGWVLDAVWHQAKATVQEINPSPSPSASPSASPSPSPHFLIFIAIVGILLLLVAGGAYFLSDPVYVEPADPVYVEPADPVYVEPAAPVYVEPADPVYVEPADPVYVEPADPVYVEPSPVPEPTPQQGSSIYEDHRAYTVYNNGTYFDKTSGLQWLQCPLGQNWLSGSCIGVYQIDTIENWQETLTQLKSLGSIAGYTDWRMPTLSELQEARGRNIELSEPLRVWPHQPPASDQVVIFTEAAGTVSRAQIGTAFGTHMQTSENAMRLVRRPIVQGRVCQDC